MNQCPVYHAGYLGHNRVWDLAAKAPVSTSHQHHDLQSLSLFPLHFSFCFFCFHFFCHLLFVVTDRAAKAPVSTSHQHHDLQFLSTFTFFKFHFFPFLFHFIFPLFSYHFHFFTWSSWSGTRPPPLVSTNTKTSNRAFFNNFVCKAKWIYDICKKRDIIPNVPKYCHIGKNW